MTTCQACELPFTPRRSTARFCSDRCRKANARQGADSVPRARGVRRGAVLSVPRYPTLGDPTADSNVTLIPPVIPASKPAIELPPGIVRDAKYPNMYRLRLLDGSLSDMVNLTRAKDALAALSEGSAT